MGWPKKMFRKIPATSKLLEEKSGLTSRNAREQSSWSSHTGDPHMGKKTAGNKSGLPSKKRRIFATIKVRAGKRGDH